MDSTNPPRPETASEAKPAAPHPPAAVTPPPPPSSLPPPSAAAKPPSRRLRRWLLLAALVVGLAVGGYFLFPTVETMLNTVSTDDAYVNSHVTYVAPRVEGQVARVFVDDNYRVKRGDILVQLDKEPYQVQLAIREAAVETAKADLVAAEAQVRAQVAQAHANRYKLEHAMEDVRTQIANLSAAVATLHSKEAALDLAKANLERGEKLRSSGGISKEDLNQREQTVKVDEAAVDQALQEIYAIRAGLGLSSPKPEKGKVPTDKELLDAPDNLDQTFSTVQSSLSTLAQSAAQYGYFPASLDATPMKVFEEFYKQVPSHNFDDIIKKLIPEAPAIKQAKTKLVQTEKDLDQAKLNLRYCDVVSEIDGVVTRRNVNPGNRVAVGQNLMAVRSLTEIWIDANFKETQLADLRIGQRVRCEVDMYGSRHEYEGRITGFTMGTGQTLALLPPQNATGNFVKIVQRLPVRIELTDYDPDRDPPLFAGLSVEPYVYYKEPVDDKIPNAGKVLQSVYPLPQGPTSPTPQLPMVTIPQGPMGATTPQGQIMPKP
jgi:membrane fusion protein, multidrug efflux system